MAEVEKMSQIQSEAMQFSKMAADIGMKVAEPMERTNNKLIKALIFTNAFWAFVLALFIALAYLTPTTYEQEQSQDFPSQTQEQTNKGSVS